MNRIFAALVCVVLADLMAPSSAPGVLITYNEATQGDLAGSISSGPNLTPSPLVVGDRLSVAGNLNAASGPNFDGQDSFKFTSLSSLSVDISSLILGSATGLLITINDGTTFASIGFQFVTPTSNKTNIFGLLRPGSYAISMTPLNNSGSLAYSINVNAVPEPSSLVLVGLAGAIGMPLTWAGWRSWRASV